MKWTVEVISELTWLLPSELGQQPYKYPFEKWLRDLSGHRHIVMEKALDRTNADHLASSVKKADTQYVSSSGKNNV